MKEIKDFVHQISTYIDSNEETAENLTAATQQITASMEENTSVMEKLRTMAKLLKNYTPDASFLRTEPAILKTLTRRVLADNGFMLLPWARVHGKLTEKADRYNIDVSHLIPAA